MGKPSHERRLSDKEAQAVTRNLRISPQKLNLVAAMIRGKKVETALAVLEFSRKRIATDVRKCLMSAIANAENNHSLDVNQLVVKEAWVGKNLILKRFAARGRGRGSAIRKLLSEITVVVHEKEEIVEPAKSKTEKRGTAKAVKKEAA
jgi:large subunit ribosomal protein L22